ncbi:MULTISPECIES: hypothetical protein [Flavobacteriaceae]|uniref:hypothetical protein n=1 Tax=Flavobacteriaceae TaxID=49546 RepID=UPI0014917B73|nr:MULTISPECIES: hypothetical protein [Allomuricauda]MDC6366430.1 hypothetical protein [Muricauda sp. AC10]
MKKIIVPIFAIMACTFFGSCDLESDSPNFHFTTLKVVEAELPESFELNTTYDLQVTYERPNGCTFFEGFDVDKIGQTDRDVAVIGTVLTDENAACTQAIEQVVATLRFQVIFTEDYNFRFYAGQDASENPVYLEYTVPVE